MEIVDIGPSDVNFLKIHPGSNLRATGTRIVKLKLIATIATGIEDDNDHGLIWIYQLRFR